MVSNIAMYCRYGMTVVSNMAVYVVAWVVFGQAGGKTVGPHDEDKFRYCTVVSGYLEIIAGTVL